MILWIGAANLSYSSPKIKFLAGVLKCEAANVTLADYQRPLPLAATLTEAPIMPLTGRPDREQIVPVAFSIQTSLKYATS